MFRRAARRTRRVSRVGARARRCLDRRPQRGRFGARDQRGSARPIVPFPQRATVLLALRSVDAVVGFRRAYAGRLLDRIRPDVHVKSDQYREEELPERTRRAAAYGGRIALAPHVGGASTTDTIARISAMRIASPLTAGEVAGWLRPLLRSLYERAPALDAHRLSRPRRLCDRASRPQWCARAFPASAASTIRKAI